MSAARGVALYTRDLLALAVSLADYPFDETLPRQGEARSRSCGSTLTFACALDDRGRIERPGLQIAACAVGQAAAALFAAHAAGRTGIEVSRTLGELEAWLAGEGGLPDWPSLSAIEPARAYPGRHGAIVLAWKAASQALCNEDRES